MGDQPIDGDGRAECDALMVIPLSSQRLCDVVLTVFFGEGAEWLVGCQCPRLEIERLPDVLYVGRPAFGQPDSEVRLYKVDGSSNVASRVPVQLGKSSVNLIQIVNGLAVGDKVILSDTSAFDQNDRVKLK